MNNVLKGWLVDNALTPENKEDKILLLESAGSLTLNDLLEAMRSEGTGLRQEALAHAVSLFQRKVAEFVLNGYSVNTGLFRAAPQFRGVVEGGVWNPRKNSIYVSILQDKDLREAVAATEVKILGEKGDTAYILSGEDTYTRATDGTATPGRNYRLRGRFIKVTGDHPAVGVTLTDSEGTARKLSVDMIPVNNPSELILLLPADLAEGAYTLTLTTQFSGGGKFLKTPRSMGREIVV